MTVIKAKHFDSALVRFAPPKHILGGNHVIPLTYEGGPLVVQLPRCTVSRGIYDLDGKHYLDILAQRGGVIEALVTGLQQRAAHHLRHETSSYGLHEHHVHTHMSMVSRDADHVTHALRLKVPRIGQRYQVTVRCEDGIEQNVTHVQSGGVVLVLATVESVYCINGIAGFNLNVKEIRTCLG